uniref:Furin n=1 Tax=Eptatretus burgeri TaxID=7764 RepID=A0A8C4NFQ3_EPTBU
MRILYIPLSVFLASCVCARPQHKVYSNSWAVRVHGGADVASQLASRHGYTYLGKVFDDLYHFQHQKVHKRSLRIYKGHHHVNLLQEPAVYAVQQQVVKIRTKRTALLEPTDPLYDSQWYLGPDQKSHVESHLNVPSAWDQGYTGRGVVVSILDDGIEKAHPDLAPNYDPDASYDLNGNDPDPEARETKNDNNRDIPNQVSACPAAEFGWAP